MTTADVVSSLRRAIGAAEHNRVAALYAPDALFDVNLPQWRFQTRGPHAIRKQLDDWHPQPPDLVEWRDRATPWGAVVELALWEGDNLDLYSRSIHILDINNDTITQHLMYCTGDWSRDALRETHARLFEVERQTAR